jgi:hypothetical protein
MSFVTSRVHSHAVARFASTTSRVTSASLHAEGHVDAKRMKLTLSGFAIAAAMRECKLREARIRERPSQMNVA